MNNSRIFSGVFSTGIIWADRKRLKHGDYAPLAFLPFDTLVLRVESDCPHHLRIQIEADARAIQDRKGEQYQVSSSGQTVTLGWAA